MRKIAVILCMSMLLCTGCIKVVEIPYSQVTVENEVFEDKFYYSQYSKEEQLVYREIYQGIQDEAEEIYVHSEEPEKVNDILKTVGYDFGEIFWIDGSGVSTAYETPIGEEKYVVLEPSYVYTKEERTKRIEEIETAATEIISAIPAEYTEYDIIKYIYEYLIDHVAYVEEAPDNQNLYSALVKGETVCAGYAKANQYLLNKMGISCIYVVGSAAQDGKSENHAWNIVRCNGKHYYVDVTWADSLDFEKEPEVKMDILYDFLCCSEKTIAATHTPEADYAFPRCDSEDLNYYRMNQMFYETADRKQLLNAMYRSIDAKEKSTILKFPDEITYAQGNALLQESLVNTAAQHLAQRYHLPEVMYYYEEQNLLNKIIIYWYYE